jgi:hypothetical protein
MYHNEAKSVKYVKIFVRDLILINLDKTKSGNFAPFSILSPYNAINSQHACQYSFFTETGDSKSSGKISHVDL